MSTNRLSRVRREQMTQQDKAHTDQGVMRSLFESNHAIMLLVDPEDGHLADANPAACRFYGYTREQLRSMNIGDINTMSPQDLRVTIDTIASYKQDYFHFEHRKSDGTVADVEVYTGPVTIDGHSYLFSIIHDISKRMAAQAELQGREESLRRAEQIANLGYWSIDLKTRTVRASDGAREIYGEGPEELTLATVQSYPLPKYRPLLDEALRGLLEEGKPYDVEFQIQRGGDGRIVDVHSIAEFDVETKTVFGVMQDITARKDVERELERHKMHLEDVVSERTAELEAVNAELRRATQAKSNFLANMSHELRTPLNSIIGFSGVLSQGLAGDLNEEQLRQVTMIGNAGKHLLELVSEVLDLSRIESGQLAINPGVFDIRDVIERVLANAGSMAEERALELRTSCECSDLSSAFRSDQLRVEQILNNLVGNAIKFTDAGSVTLSVTCDEEMCEFRVKDTGRGIPDRELGAIFEEYYQLHHDDVAKSRGVGLGLPLAKRLAEMLGGDITVTSELDVGSEFVLRLPSMAEA